MSDNSTLATKELAVELAYADDRGPCWQMNLNFCINDWLNARRAARESGMLSVPLGADTTAALDRQQALQSLYKDDQLDAARTVCNLLARDLGSGPKEPTP